MFYRQTLFFEYYRNDLRKPAYRNVYKINYIISLVIMIKKKKHHKTNRYGKLSFTQT